MMLIVGCILSSTETDEIQGDDVVCNPPYIRAGVDCCLDVNDNMVCDSDEATTSLTQTTTTSIFQTTTTQEYITSTITSLATTTSTIKETTSLGVYAGCAFDHGVSPDTVIYIYTKKCCDPIVTDRVRAVENMGYGFKYLGIDSISSGDRSLLECYMDLQDIFVPQFICAGTGDVMLLTDPGGMTSRIKNFADECKVS
ncbi:MAG: hypothetical protein KAU03_06905 [Candidatus Altiarchaeales archaeon]|nr:hypothetical protein [Candidatus Altiarchaeales archaeon]